MESDIQFLEFLKYFTLKGSKVGFRTSNNYIDYISSDTLVTTPEGFSFTIKRLRVNIGLFSFSSNENDEDYFKYYDLRNLVSFPSNNIGNHMIPEFVLNSSYSDNTYTRFVFVSDFYQKFKLENPNWITETFNQYGINNTSYDYYPYSMVILVKSSDLVQFQTFLNLEYGQPILTVGGETTYMLEYEPFSIEAYEPNCWKFFFNKSLGNALKNNDFNNFFKYDKRILKTELSIENRKALLNYLVYQEYWGIIDFDGLNEAEFFYDLLKYINENDEVEMYNFFFENNSLFFINAMSKFGSGSYDDLKFKVIIFLLKCFYKKSSQNFENDNISNQIENLSENRIIPIIGNSLSFYGGYSFHGAMIQTEYTNVGVKIVNLKIHKLINKNSNDFKTAPVDYFLSDGSLLIDSVFPYETMLGGYCCTTSTELVKVGLLQGRIYIFPAFALFSINEVFSKGLSIVKVLSDFANMAGFFIPFFKIIQGVNIFANLSAMGFSLIGNALDQGLSNKLKESQEGRNFLIAYNFITAFYGVKGVKDSFKEFKFYMIKDLESLLNIWGVYQNTQFFLEIDQLNETNALKKELNKLKDDMQKYQELYNMN
jgi:hypothetical protein